MNHDSGSKYNDAPGAWSEVFASTATIASQLLMHRALEKPMSNDSPLTAEQFAESRHELEDGGRWVELIAGQVTVLDPPSDVHGNVVLNLSKALGEYLHQSGRENGGYLCFETGLVVARRPDTIYFPAISYVMSDNRFGMTDATILEVPPRLVVDIASSPARALKLDERIVAYHNFGVEAVWGIDTLARVVHVAQRGEQVKTLEAHETLAGEPTLPGFRIGVESLFATPAWYA